MNYLKRSVVLRILIGVGLLFVLLSKGLQAQTLTAFEVEALSEERVQLAFAMTEKASLPKIFQMNSPARIILDFVNVKSALQQKRNAINQAGISNLLAVTAGNRLRLILNLKEYFSYALKVQDNKVLLVLEKKKASNPALLANSIDGEKASVIPQQAIKKVDFRRGKKGEGHVLISLSNKNILVKTEQKSGKIEVRFINTRLPDNYKKRLDVLDFATPVSMIDAQQSGADVTVLITPRVPDYKYSIFQSQGLLTLTVREITLAEQKAKAMEYTGERLTLDFHDIEVRNAFKILAEISKVNIIVNDSVGGNLTLQLDDVPWDQAFELVLKMKGLSQRRKGDVILVAPMEEIRKLEEEEVKANQVVERLEPLITEYIQINYAQASNFQSILEGNSSGGINGCSVAKQSTSGSTSNTSNTNSTAGQSGLAGVMNGGNSATSTMNNRLLSQRGSAIVDSRTNTLIVKDTEKHLEEIRKMLKLLDKPVRQVLIEARIVSATEGFAQELGVKFGAAYNGGDGAQTGFGLGSSTGGDAAINGVSSVAPLLSNLAASNPYGALGMTLASGVDYVLNLEISALQDDNKGEFISNPRVLTSDRCQATIEQGEEIPFQTTSQEGTTTIFKDAKIILEVTPQITPSGSVIMELKITKDSRGDQTLDGLAINKQEINTSVHMLNGETVVLGGVYEDTASHIINKVPWFSDLPLIGWLFEKKIDNNSKRELLFFITPKIMKESLRIQA